MHLTCIQEIAKLWNSFNPKNGEGDSIETKAVENHVVCNRHSALY